MRNLSNWLARHSSGRVTLIALLVFILFTILVLPAQSRSRQDAGAGTPDLSFYYSAGQLYHMADAYGAQGRRAYIQARFTFDLVWPLVYTFSLVTALSWCLQRLIPGGARWRSLNLLPLAGAAFDYLENISTSLVMARYPAPADLLAGLAGVFTAIKWLLIGLSSLLLLVCLGLALLKRRDPQV